MTSLPLAGYPKGWESGAKLRPACNTDQFQSQGIGIYILQASQNGILFFSTLSVCWIMHGF